MIHFTLLPEKETKTLKREYRARIFITLFFFISCASILGILSLLPAYIYSYYQEKIVLDSALSIEKSKEIRGTNEVISELGKVNKIIKKIKDNEKSSLDIPYLIGEILKDKSEQISINSIDISKAPDGSSPSIPVILQGKSRSRDGLVAFKSNLEKDPLISKVELPISDLAKSKDITFAIRFNITINNN